MDDNDNSRDWRKMKQEVSKESTENVYVSTNYNILYWPVTVHVELSMSINMLSYTLACEETLTALSTMLRLIHQEETVHYKCHMCTVPLLLNSCRLLNLTKLGNLFVTHIALKLILPIMTSKMIVRITLENSKPNLTGVWFLWSQSLGKIPNTDWKSEAFATYK
jgi:hypothetical protein